jgi:hypothetical protein
MCSLLAHLLSVSVNFHSSWLRAQNPLDIGVNFPLNLYTRKHPRKSILGQTNEANRILSRSLV